MDRKDQLLCFLAADEEPTDPIRIMKGLFLFAQEVQQQRITDVSDTYQFAPMSYGPCAPIIYDDLAELAESGEIVSLPVPGETWRKYQITEAGKRELATEGGGSPETQEFLRSLRQWCDRQSFSSLLKAVYRAYPQFAANSVLPHLRPNG